MRVHASLRAYTEILQNLARAHRFGHTHHLVDNFTFPSVLKVCTQLRAQKQGHQIHALVLLLGFKCHLYTANSLISLYCSFGDLQSAIKVFDQMPQRNTVTWNSIMAGFIRNGFAHASLSYFSRMLQTPQNSDSVTMCTVLHVHARIGVAAFRSGRAVHGHIIRKGSYVTTATMKRPFLENALIHMYMESSCLNYAEKIFHGMPMKVRDLITWTSMISGYMNYKLEKFALSTFRSMIMILTTMQEGCQKLDPVILNTVIPAVMSLRQGKEVHCYAMKSSYDRLNAFVATSLLQMYAEFGAIEYAVKLFEIVEERNVAVWSAMITAYAKHGRSEDSLRLFDEMQLQAGVIPNHLTFMGVLTACTHGGLVGKAQECFKCMTKEYGLTPDMYHYAAMVDVMGRAGHLKEALEFIEAMPMEPSGPVWGSLLASCGLHQDLELGCKVAKIVSGMEPQNSGNFVFLSNMLAQDGRWNDAKLVRETMRHLGLRKLPATSLVDVQQPNL